MEAFFCMLELEDKIKLKKDYLQRCDVVEEKFTVYKLNHKDKTVDMMQIDLSKIIKKVNKMGYIDNMLFVGYVEESEFVSIIQEKMQEGTIKKTCEYIVPVNGRNDLLNKYNVKSTNVLKKHMFLYYVTENGQEKVCLEQEDEENFYKFVLHLMDEYYFNDTYKRNAIPALNGFSELCVERIPSMVCGIVAAKSYNIISPLLRDDIELMGKYGKEAYADMIINRDDFKNLVNYVYENQVGEYSVDIIRQKYIKLIYNSYDWYYKMKGVEEEVQADLND